MPLTFAAPAAADTIMSGGTIRIANLAEAFARSSTIQAEVDGSPGIKLNHDLSERQIAGTRSGSLLNHFREASA